jgi:hypothetical protein
MIETSQNPEIEPAQIMVGHVRCVLRQIIDVALAAPSSPDMAIVESLAACADAALFNAETSLEEHVQ